MKKFTSLLVLILLSGALLAQERDSLLRQINQIKKDTDRYLYGLATVPGEDNPAVSREQAAKELAVQVEAFLNTDQFVYLKQMPDSLQLSVACLLRPSCYRTIVYVEKERLLAVEQSLVSQLENDTRKESLQQFLDGVLQAKTVNEILDLIAASPLSGEIRAGQKIDNETQVYANEGLLVYFEPKSKKVLEVMTPMDDNYARKNAKTGAPAQPMRYKSAPLWIYIEGLKNNNVL